MVDLLPRDHLIRVSPDFRPKLLAAVRKRRRQRAAIRIALILGAVTLVALLVFSIARHYWR
jgi:hypothetical protein